MGIEVKKQTVYCVSRHGHNRRYFTKKAAVRRLAVIMTDKVFNTMDIEIFEDRGGWADGFIRALERMERRLTQMIS